MKNKEHLIKAAFLLVSVLLVGAILLLIYNFRPGQKEKSISVGAVLIGAKDDHGWNESHYNGLQTACDALSCTLQVRENVPEEMEALKETVAELKELECSCIFLTSYGYGLYADEIAGLYPEVAFYCISGEAAADNCMSYFARMYQARYLAGIAAGAATESGLLGYVTAIPIPETIRSINAYCMGARKANPEAKVLVIYTGGWDDKEEEEGAVKKLAGAGADVITFHEDRPYAIDLADKMGLFTTGYDYVSGDYSEKFLTASVFDWDMLYKKVLGDYLSGRADFSNDYWLGLSDGAVSLYPYSPLVTEETKKLIKKEEERIRTSRDVFSGEIYDNNGILHCQEDERISDDELFNSIDWYVEGVDIYE